MLEADLLPVFEAWFSRFERRRWFWPWRRLRKRELLDECCQIIDDLREMTRLA